jgi:hypothetical protein
VQLAAIFALIKSLADLGASPAVQQVVLAFIAKAEGVSQEALTAFIKAEQEAKDPVSLGPTGVGGGR